MTILHIDSSILGENSASRTLSAAVVSQLQKGTPEATVVARDLAKNPLGHLTASILAGESPVDASPTSDVVQGRAALDEFLAAKTVVIGAPMYNFAIPSQLKAWIDRICVAGKTFRYTAEGVQGLAWDKKAILVITRGGLYGAGAPAASFEHQESYLRAVLTFIGVNDITTIIAEGLAMGSSQREASLQNAMEQISRL